MSLRLSLIVTAWGTVLLVAGSVLCQQASLGQLSGPRASDVREEDAERLFHQAVLLGVPEKDLEQLVDACRRRGFTGIEVSRVLSLVARAKLAGLPHADLLNKLREGLAKGAGPEAIVRAMDEKARVLRRAKDLADTLLMEGWSTPDRSFSIQVVADALEAGVSPAEILCSVREGRPCEGGAADLRGAFLKLPREE